MTNLIKKRISYENMKLYHQEMEINTPLAVVWQYLQDLQNFGKFNRYHHGVTFSTEQKQGVGTEFVTGHTFWPIFPLPPLKTKCLVTQWEVAKDRVIVSIAETPVTKRNKPISITKHTQQYTLQARGKNKTKFSYDITYKGIPDWVPVYAKYVNGKVNATMIHELEEIKKLLET